MPNFYECFYRDRNTENMFSISFKENRGAKNKTTYLLWSSKCIVFARAIITSTAPVAIGSVETVLNQSLRVFALGYFLNRTIRMSDVLFLKDIISCSRASGSCTLITQLFSHDRSSVQHSISLSVKVWIDIDEHFLRPRKIWSCGPSIDVMSEILHYLWCCESGTSMCK